ncbi:MAG: hypothetical protein RLZZ126_961 [Pseudomonadota bacterium]|jgi:geranyl-CoA carboxylase alpha subunit
MNTSPSFEKILIANRGEIACRVIRTAHRLGYSTVAVYSDADAQAPHVALADEAVHIGASPARASYLDIGRIMAAAQQAGAGAIHPGYGFLSENPAFADACVQAGLTFIGPSAASMRAMGDKARAKARMRQAGVPCAPGYLAEDADTDPAAQSDERLMQEAAALGYPLLIKAVAGGGGRGMRLVHAAGELPAAMASARREAQSAFGSDVLMLERLIERGRHIEIQIFADSHGNAVYLGERDCTAQRRRQKVIEEAPSPIVTPQMREVMGRDAVAAALAVGYQGAGTVEFIVDQNLHHYFLEMNTRLQVEHPVTECITGQDLVEWQIRVARGEPLPLNQDAIRLEGHAIEVRLYAEDPTHAFAPQTGTVLHWQPDAARADGTRVDSGIEAGGSVSPFYDPMVAKFIAHGCNRDDAIRQLRRALAQSPLIGLRNNGAYLRDLLDTPEFRMARMHTALLDEWLEQGHALYQGPETDNDLWALAAALFATRTTHSTACQTEVWRPRSVSAWDMHLQCGSDHRSLRVEPGSGGVEVTQRSAGATAVSSQKISFFPSDQAFGELSFLQQDKRRKAVVVWQHGDLHLALDGSIWSFSEVSPYPDSGQAANPLRATAPVAGKVAQVLVLPGDAVQEGQPLACIEAMKMEMWVPAAVAGTVRAVHAKAGEQVELGALLVELTPPT